ncbi:MAG: efflux RND transporter permease subunit [Bacteroidota bacterium]|nr:efflux RND transporter permease subunit [Candidatus Kapabacteria bacterium]MDW8220944.1 efflux RND transporter permease subunit [Bacteroidota bacterium]
MTMTELAIKRPTLVVVLFAVLGVLGVMGYIQLKYDLLPKINPPVVVITTIYPGASPSEVETNVSKVIEDAVSGMDKVVAIRSSSAEGRSTVVIELAQSANLDFSLQEAQRKVNQISNALPKDARTPIIARVALDELPVIRMGATSNLPNREFYQFMKDKVQPRFSKLSGVAQVTLVGGEERQIQINLNADKIRSFGLSIPQVAGIIKASNLDFPTGKVKDSEHQYVVRLAGKLNSLEEVKNIVLSRTRTGGEIRLADVAEVHDGIKEIVSMSRVNGVASIGVLITKQSDANSVEVSQLIRKEIEHIERDYATYNLRFTIAQDGSMFTIDAADAVKHDLMIAVVLVAAVMLLFLHSIRSSLIVMVAIPTSLISTMAGMWWFGFSLNLMTLLAMSLVIGILVDDSIVVLENIYRHLEMGKDRRKAALEGRNEIGFAALSITLVDVVVFVPLALLPGIVGNILREFSVVVAVSTLFSLLVSFTVTPVLASRFAQHERLDAHTLMGRFALWFERMFHRATEYYKHLLIWALKHRMATVMIVIVMLIASLALIPLGFIGTEFVAQADRGEFSIQIELPPGATLEQTNQTTLAVERIVASIPEVQRTFVNVGAATSGFIGVFANNTAEVNVTLVPLAERKRSTDDIMFDIKRQTAGIPGVKVRAVPIGIFGGANETPIQMVISGATYEEVLRAAKDIRDIVAQVPGTSDVRLSSEDGKPETRIEIDREKLAAFGLTINDVGATLRIALAGDDDAKFREGNTEYTMLIALDQFDRSKPENLGSLTFVNPRGQVVELRQFARIVQSVGPTQLQRENRNSAITLFSQVVGRPVGTVAQEIDRALVGKLPAGISYTYTGSQKNQQESFQSMGIAICIAILFVYFVMVALYDSYIYPFVVMFSVPVAVVGALLALALANKALSVFTMLGIIMLVGLVTKNAILIVDRANQVRREYGLSAYDALIEAGQLRLRPIVMTTVAMVVGMLPIAIGSGAAGEWKSGLGWSLIGGLTSSMFLTLVLVPVVYITFDRWRVSVPEALQRLFGTKAKIAEDQHDSLPIGFPVAARASEHAPVVRSAVHDKSIL